MCFNFSASLQRWISSNGFHGLICKQASSKITIHQAISDVIASAFASVGIYPNYERTIWVNQTLWQTPTDGITLTRPRQSRMSLTWDFAIVRTPARCLLSSLQSTCLVPFSWWHSRHCCIQKRTYTLSISAEYVLQPVTLETFGSVNSSFVSSVSRQLTYKPGDVRDTSFLLHILSI